MQNFPQWRRDISFLLITGASGVICLACGWFIDIPFRDSNGITSWVTENRYSKADEIFNYLLAVLIWPMLSLIGFQRLLWIGRGASQISDDQRANAQTLTESSWNSSISVLLRIVWRMIGWVLIPVTLFVLLNAQSIDGIIDFFHEGETLAPAHELTRGGVPFSDIYTQHGFGKNILVPKMAFALFGESVESLRRMEQIALGITALAVYALCCCLFRSRSLGAGICCFLLCGWQFWVQSRNLFPTLVLLALSYWIEEECRLEPRRQVSKRMLLYAGAGTALSFWFSVDVGIFITAAAGIFVALFELYHRNYQFLGLVRVVSQLLAGAAAVHVAVMLVLLSNGALAPAIQNVFEQSAYQLTVWGLPHPSISLLYSQLSESVSLFRGIKTSEALPFYFSLMLIVSGLFYFLYQHGEKNLRFRIYHWKGILLLIVSVAFYRTALGRSSSAHLVNATPFLWIMLFFAFERSCTQALSRLRQFEYPGTRVLVHFVFLAAGIGYFWIVYQPVEPWRVRWGALASAFSQTPSQPTNPLVGRITIPQSQAEQIGEVVTFIHRHVAPNETIFDFSNNGAYYFFADRKNSTRFHQSAYIATDTMQREAISRLEAEKTPLVIFSTGTGWDAPDGVPNLRRQKLLAEYLTQKYAPAANIRGTVLLLRND
jgi:hypothetical protein